MSLALLHEGRSEIRRLLIAGANLAKGDYRLKRIHEELKKAGEKSPVFSRAATQLEGCVQCEGDAAGLVLETGAFLSAVLYTQASIGHESAFCDHTDDAKALFAETFGTEYVANAFPDASPPDSVSGYRILYPVMQALTTKAGGRYEVIKEAAENGTLYDRRLLPLMLNGLGDSYSEIPAILIPVLSKCGRRTVLPLLASFDINDTGRLNKNRFSALAAIMGKRGVNLYQKVYMEGPVELRAQAVGSIGGISSMQTLILEAAKDPRKEVRDAAEAVIAKSPFKAAFNRLFGKKG